jgi:hypothetical protein
MSSTSGTRGIRLANPGNLRHGEPWQGMSEDQPDPDFVKFTAAQFGVRAMGRTLLTYKKKNVLTVRAIIGRWAPPVENDTDAYVDHVAQLLGVTPDEAIDVDDCEIALKLVKAIIKHENANQQPYSDKMLLEGLRMAGIHNAPAKKLTQRGAFQTQGAAAVASGLGLVAAVAEPVKKAADGLEPFQGSPIIGQVVIALLTLAGAATLAGVIREWIKSKRGL